MTPAAAAGFAAGLLLGLGYFVLLAAAGRAWVRGSPFGQHLMFLAVRAAAAVAGFWLLVQWGAVTLLAGFAGFLLARLLAVRFVRP